MNFVDEDCIAISCESHVFSIRLNGLYSSLSSPRHEAAWDFSRSYWFDFDTLSKDQRIAGCKSQWVNVVTDGLIGTYKPMKWDLIII